MITKSVRVSQSGPKTAVGQKGRRLKDSEGPLKTAGLLGSSVAGGRAVTSQGHVLSGPLQNPIFPTEY